MRRGTILSPCAARKVGGKRGWALPARPAMAAARQPAYTKQSAIFSACGGAALYRKKAFWTIGGFDEHLFAYFEDVDLSWRANNAGF